MRASKAPDGRINISYKLAGEERELKELPLRMLAIGDFTGRDSDVPVAEREPVQINQLNFDQVMKRHDVSVELHGVQSHKDADGKPSLADQHARPISLTFEKITDFHPDEVLQQLTRGKAPQMKALADAMKLREALVMLRGPMGTRASFRKALEEVIRDETSRNALKSKLGL